MLDAGELGRLTAAAAAVPLTKNEYNATDFVVALVETVMDYRNNTTTVERAGQYFEEHRAPTDPDARRPRGRAGSLSR